MEGLLLSRSSEQSERTLVKVIAWTYMYNNEGVFSDVNGALSSQYAVCVGRCRCKAQLPLAGLCSA